MNILPEIVYRELDDEISSRKDPDKVDIALQQLSVSVPSSFLEFFHIFAGPFGSRKTGFELLDMIRDEDNIVSFTMICREEFSFPTNYLVISTYLGNAVLVYDTSTDKVYNVDFEGGDEELLRHELEARWDSFYEFLEYFFS